MRISEKKGFLIFISFCVIVFLIAKWNDGRRIAHLSKGGLYSIATIDSYTHFIAGNRTGSSKSAEVEYSFQIGDKYFKDSHSAGIPKGVKEGKRYFLLIDKEDFRKTEIFFDRPIKDSTDFQRYVKEFEERRKKP
jgi:hypothetical protein